MEGDGPCSGVLDRQTDPHRIPALLVESAPGLCRYRDCRRFHDRPGDGADEVQIPEAAGPAFDAAPAEEGYDSSDRPFDFLEEGVETALICEGDPVYRVKLQAALESFDYRVTTPQNSREALKQMRFHVFDMIVVNEKPIGESFAELARPCFSNDGSHLMVCGAREVEGRLMITREVLSL